MPDESKFEKLRAAGYRIPVACRRCVHGLFPSAASPWGTCLLHRYEHGKHHNPTEGRGVSVHACGTCPSAALGARTDLGAHIEFLEEP